MLLFCVSFSIKYLSGGYHLLIGKNINVARYVSTGKSQSSRNYIHFIFVSVKMLFKNGSYFELNQSPKAGAEQCYKSGGAKLKIFWPNPPLSVSFAICCYLPLNTFLSILKNSRAPSWRMVCLLYHPSCSRYSPGMQLHLKELHVDNER